MPLPPNLPAAKAAGSISNVCASALIRRQNGGKMFGEAWRLQREHFWVEDLSQVDWKAIYDRYLPLLDRVATRTEFTDLLTEMHGELGSSHAYVMGGDFRDEPRYDIGFLGADL